MTNFQKLKIIVVSIVIILIFSVSGVYASWRYAGSEVPSYSHEHHLSAFTWTGSDVLPDDDASAIGQNHIELINNILHEASYGLNATKKPIIHNELDYVGDVLYCQQNTSGGNLKHLLLDGTSAHALLFQIEYISDSEYNLYTYSEQLIRSTAYNSSVEVYLTVMKANNAGVWDAIASYKGTATVVKISGKVPHAIDSKTFKVSTTSTN